MMHEDAEDDDQFEDEERFSRNAIEDNGASVDYYNNWIMENKG